MRRPTYVDGQTSCNEKLVRQLLTGTTTSPPCCRPDMRSLHERLQTLQQLQSYATTCSLHSPRWTRACAYVPTCMSSLSGRQDLMALVQQSAIPNPGHASDTHCCVELRDRRLPSTRPTSQDIARQHQPLVRSRCASRTAPSVLVLHQTAYLANESTVVDHGSTKPSSRGDTPPDYPSFRSTAFRDDLQRRQHQTCTPLTFRELPFVQCHSHWSAA